MATHMASMYSCSYISCFICQRKTNMWLWLPYESVTTVGKTEPKVHTKYIKLYISVNSAILDCCSKLTAKWFVQFQSRWSQIWQIDYSKPENLKTGLGLVWHIDYAISKKASKICCSVSKSLNLEAIAGAVEKKERIMSCAPPKIIMKQPNCRSCVISFLLSDITSCYLNQPWAT